MKIEIVALGKENHWDIQQVTDMALLKSRESNAEHRYLLSWIGKDHRFALRILLNEMECKAVLNQIKHSLIIAVPEHEA